MAKFRATYKVCLDDVDMFGIMHHANFIRYFERARIDWWQQLGFRLDELLKQGIGFVVKKIEIDYVAPAKVYDKISVVTSIISQRKVSQVYEQIVCHFENPDQTICRGLVTVVCVNDQLKPRPYPLEAITKFNQNSL